MVWKVHKHIDVAAAWVEVIPRSRTHEFKEGNAAPLACGSDTVEVFGDETDHTKSLPRKATHRNGQPRYRRDDGCKQWSCMDIGLSTHTVSLRVSRGITHGSPFARMKAATGSTSTLATARPPTIATQPIIILFDGVCNLCSEMVRFVIARNPHAQCRFAALQSEAARATCAKVGYELPAFNTPSTIVVIEGGRALERSDAALAIARRMSFPWPMFGVFRVLPRGLRDALYRFVAHNRYRWFGRTEACMVPRVELQERFLD